MSPRVATSTAALLVALLAGQARADGLLTPRHSALLLLRVIVYDRNLDRRIPANAAPVVILYRPGRAESEAERDGLLAAFDQVALEVVAAGRPVRAQAVAFRSEAELDEKLAAPAAAVYLCTGLESAVEPIIRVTRRRSVLSVSGSRALADAGVAIALVNRGSRAGVLVNVAAARAEGADLDSALLAVAEVIEAREGAAAR